MACPITQVMTEQGTMTGDFLNALAGGNQLVKVIKAIIFLLLICLSLFGNALVIVAICKFRRLRRNRTNIFILSLAMTDFLVAFLVMPFNAILVLSNGFWPFAQWMCKWFNSNDVLLSTASIIHICCISVDRYIAVFSPLQYEYKMRRKKVVAMLIFCWIASFLISYIPIWSNIYVKSGRESPVEESNQCNFKVNSVYAIMSSTVSFWIPCIVMTTLYAKIYREARRQKQKLVSIMPQPQQKQYSISDCKRYNYSNDGPEIMEKNLGETILDDGSKLLEEPSIEMLKSRPRRPGNKQASQFPELMSINIKNCEDSENVSKENKENKAAKTLGIIMGAFIMCWLPFFLWYTISFVCGEDTCKSPEIIVEVLFWIGYSNSTLNPMIYASFNREFRTAFMSLLGFKRQRRKLKCSRWQYVDDIRLFTSSSSQKRERISVK
ncbi:Serpentine type 7TM GPCR chemoreceptor Srx [Cichlidogyrus casuarinus]|uniref:Serpentine type 7TM GPCR chemoreceptor Srx n=1 Tax=Cichlidogyrus casuarinus TaxID=1844966 RepID=A0ABD2Q0A3_9PLAT